MAINKLRAIWNNFPGAPGYTTVYSSGLVTPTLAALRGFFDAVKGFIPNGTTVSFPGTGDILDEATGAVTGAWSTTPPTTVVSTATAGRTYAGAAGVCVSWRTNNLVAGRRPIGRSYLVPLISDVFAPDGTPNSTNLATIQAAADAAIAAATPGFVIWSRPRPGLPGTTSTIIAATVADVGAVLKSRRV